MTQKELKKMLEEAGWKSRPGHGSHENYYHPQSKKIVTIKRRKGKYQIPASALADYRRKTGLALC